MSELSSEQKEALVLEIRDAVDGRIAQREAKRLKTLYAIIAVISIIGMNFEEISRLFFP